MKRRLNIVMVATLIAGIMAFPLALADEAKTYKKLHGEALAALDKANRIEGEWRDARWSKSKAVKVKGKDGKSKSMSYLGAAEAYAKMGDYKNAIKYIKIAKFQGEAGYKQAMEQKRAGPRH